MQRDRETTLVVLGSNAAAKLSATTGAALRCFKVACVHGVDVPSGVPAQPVGLDETMAGAMARLRGAQKCTLPDVYAHITPRVDVAIENGLLPVRVGEATRYLDVAVVVAATHDKPDCVHVATSVGVEMHAEHAAAAAADPSATVGIRLHRARLVRDAADPHTSVTGGRLPRATLLAVPLVAVFDKCTGFAPALN
jgi:non-canonical (house-cleaning) NTP pyrophosphatase